MLSRPAHNLIWLKVTYVLAVTYNAEKCETASSKWSQSLTCLNSDDPCASFYAVERCTRCFRSDPSCQGICYKHPVTHIHARTHTTIRLETSSVTLPGNRAEFSEHRCLPSGSGVLCYLLGVRCENGSFVYSDERVGWGIVGLGKAEGGVPTDACAVCIQHTSLTPYRISFCHPPPRHRPTHFTVCSTIIIHTIPFTHPAPSPSP